MRQGNLINAVRVAREWTVEISIDGTMQRALTRRDLGSLQQGRNKRVFENIKRFVQIAARMPGGHAGAETNSIQWNGRIIDWSDPKTATAQFVTKPIHAFALTDHNWHDIRCRSSSIDAETAQLRTKIVG